MCLPAPHHFAAEHVLGRTRLQNHVIFCESHSSTELGLLPHGNSSGCPGPGISQAPACSRFQPGGPSQHRTGATPALEFLRIPGASDIPGEACSRFLPGGPFQHRTGIAPAWEFIRATNPSDSLRGASPAVPGVLVPRKHLAGSLPGFCPASFPQVLPGP